MKTVFKQIIVLLFAVCLIACGSSSGSSNGSSQGSTDANQASKTVSFTTEDGNFEITEIECTSHPKTQNHDAYVSIRIKVKNNTDKDFDYVAFPGHGYDKNEDNLNNLNIQIRDIEAGHSAWSSEPTGGTDLEHFGGIKLTGYEIADEKEGTLYRNTVVDFEKKLYLPLDQMSVIEDDR